MQVDVSVMVGLSIVLLLLAQESSGTFLEDPMNTTCTLGTPFVIRCQTPHGAVSSRWVYNNSRVFITHPPEGLSPSSFNDMFSMQLTCTRKRHYTTIQCVAILSILPNTEEPSPLAYIQVQGMPDRVTGLQNSSYPSVIELSWDILEPNATYCVTVETSSTSRSRELINETCGLHEVYFSWPRNDSKHVNTNDTQYIFRVAATNSVGRGPLSNSLETNFFSGLPDIVDNINYVPMDCAVLITWNSLGPNVTYCIQIFNSTTMKLIQDEVCEIQDLSYLFNATCPDVATTYELTLTAVTDVGRGLPSDLAQITVLPAMPLNLNSEDLMLSSTTSANGTQVLHQGSTLFMKTIIIALLSSVSAIVTSIDLLRCDAYESCRAHQMDVFDFEKVSSKDLNLQYDNIISTKGEEPLYAHIS